MASVTNFNNQLIRVESEKITALLQNLGQYSSIEIDAEYNCCNCSFKDVITNLNPDTNDWAIDFTVGVEEETTVTSLIVENPISKLQYKIPVNIPLYEVKANCTDVSCTISDFPFIYSTLKVSIDSWFASKGVTSGVAVTAINNEILIIGMPINFALVGGNINTQIDGITYPSNYLSSESKAFLGSDAIYLKPNLFSLDKIEDAVVTVTYKLVKTTGETIIQTYCGFIDVTFKCKVSQFLTNLVKSNNKSIEDTIVHLVYFGMKEGNSCGCNCKTLCELFQELNNLLEGVPEINDCGC